MLIIPDNKLEVLSVSHKAFFPPVVQVLDQVPLYKIYTPTPWKIATSFMYALLVNVKKPINILTGLDYWLDNLMCQVPEVLMCFHDEGIVKK